MTRDPDMIRVSARHLRRLLGSWGDRWHGATTIRAMWHGEVM